MPEDEKLTIIVDDDVKDMMPTRATRVGSKKENVKFQMLDPMAADKEAKEMTKHILGDLPISKNGLTSQQVTFLNFYYITLFDVAAACNSTGVTYEQFQNWEQYDKDFVSSMNIINDLVAGKIQSVTLQNAFYEKDNKLLMELLRALNSKKYGNDVVSDDGDDDLEIMSEALRSIEDERKG